MPLAQIQTRNAKPRERAWSRRDGDVFPAIDEKLVHDITASDVQAMICKIEARGALDTSRHAGQGVGTSCGSQSRVAWPPMIRRRICRGR